MVKKATMGKITIMLSCYYVKKIHIRFVKCQYEETKFNTDAFYTGNEVRGKQFISLIKIK